VETFVFWSRGHKTIDNRYVVSELGKAFKSEDLKRAIQEQNKSIGPYLSRNCSRRLVFIFFRSD